MRRALLTGDSGSARAAGTTRAPGPVRRPVGARSRLALSALAALLAAGLLSAPPALAQNRGLNPLTFPLFDWDVEVQPRENVQNRDLKFAYRRGLRDLKDGNCRSATQKFAFILDFVEDDPRLYYAAGTAARCARAFRAATGYYESTLEFDPNWYEASKFLGISRLALGDLDGAAEALGSLAVRREDCEGKCEPRLETAYTELRKAIEMARELAQNETE